MIQILAIIFLILWAGFTLFYSFSREWFGEDGLLGRALGALCWACLTTLGIYVIGFIAILLLSLAIGIT